MAVPPDGGGGRACDSGEEGECGALDANAPPFGRSCIPIGVPESCMNLDCARALPPEPHTGQLGREMQPNAGTERHRAHVDIYKGLECYVCNVYLCTYYEVRTSKKEKGGAGG